MSGILAQLGGNPFNTLVGQKIEQATDASLASENWALNMEICDIINDTDEGPKDAIKAIRKRLQQNAGKNYTVVMYALTALETCVKNCGKRFHLLVTQKDFVQDLVKLIGPKNDPPTAVQEKVLSLIQSWADAFRNVPEMHGVVQVYSDLKLKGVEFPMTDLDTMAPIHTPQRTVQVQQPVPRPPSAQPQQHSQPPQPQSENVPCGPIALNPEQLAKLRSELDIVQRNMTVFGEMLSELTPGQEHSSDWELLQELQKTCHAMQTRVVELLDKVANEEVTSELLTINDELNNLFLRYERFEKRRTAIVSSSAAGEGPRETRPSELSSATGNSAPLIDLGEPEVTSEFQNLAIGSKSTSGVKPSAKASGDEFDMFAQSRHVNYEQSKQSGSTYADNTNVDQLGVSLGALTNVRTQKLQKERDFDEMEQWLKEKPNEASGQESITSSEFDRFLAERAAAAEKLPTVPAATGASNPQRNPSSRNKMDREETENSLFAL